MGMTSIALRSLSIFMLALSPPGLAEPIELKCVLNPDQFDTEAPLSVHRFTLDRDESSVTLRIKSIESSETYTSFYETKPSSSAITLVSWLAMPGEVINLLRLVNLGDQTWSYELGFPGDLGELIQMARWGTCTEQLP
jgi:hypothetical protein